MDLKRFNKPAWKKCKGIVSRDFAPYTVYRKNVFAKFFVFANIFAKNMCQQSCSRTWFPHSERLPGHDNDYADTDGKQTGKPREKKYYNY